MAEKSSKKADKATEAQPLSVMLGMSEQFLVGDRQYEIAPLKLKEIAEFMKDEVSVGPQLFNFISDDKRKGVDKWMRKLVRDDQGNPYTLEQAMDDGWTVKDLRAMFTKALDVSG